jgi:hypothetical protein
VWIISKYRIVRLHAGAALGRAREKDAQPGVSAAAGEKASVALQVRKYLSGQSIVRVHGSVAAASS